MKLFQHFILGSLVMVVTLISACQARQEDNFDEQAWLNALENARPIEAKAEKVGEIDEVYKYPSLQGIDNESIYVLDNDECTLYIYGRRDFKRKVHFGSKGEGPGEFKIVQGLQIYPDFIFINSPAKNTYYSKKGELLKDVPCPPYLIPCLPLGKNFVTNEYSKSLPSENDKDFNLPYSEKQIVLVGPSFKVKKTLYRGKMGKYTYDMNSGMTIATLFLDMFRFQLYKDKIYIVHSCKENFMITIFDDDGDELRTIKRSYKKRKFPARIKEAISKKQHYTAYDSQRKEKVVFLEDYPALAGFYIADDRIYLFLYPDDHRQIIVVLDLNGDLVDTVSIPFNPSILEHVSYRILYFHFMYEGYRYYFPDNDVTNKWELWRSPILPVTTETK